MTKIANSPGHKIKELLSTQTKDYFEWMQDPKDREKKRLLNRAVNAIEEYRRVEFIERYKNGGFENLDEQVSYFLGQSDWQDNLVFYRFSCQHLLQALAVPDQPISTLANSAKDIAEMLTRLTEFLINLNTHPYQTLLLSRSLQDNGSEGYTDDDLLALAQEYEARLEMNLSGRIVNTY